jgi:PPOX class probable F420-dependent enzyme
MPSGDPQSMKQDRAPFSNLGRGRFALLVTYRSSGEPVPTPMWFARDGDRIYMATAGNAAKLRRIRNDPAVTVAPCRSQGRVLGPTVSATARVLTTETSDDAARAIAGRYLLPSSLIERFLRRRAGGAPPVYLELVATAIED